MKKRSSVCALGAHLSVFFACFSTCFYAHAQTPPATDSGSTILITANPLRDSITGRLAVQLDAPAALLQRASTLGDVLAELPGVSASSFGAASRPIIRGHDGDRVRILNNGASSSDASGLSSDHAVADHPLGVEKIEVLRGPAALMYGGQAAGGVINMLDDRIRATPLFDAAGGTLGRAMVGVGSAANERLAATSVQTGNTEHTFKIDAFTKDAQSYKAPIALDCTQSGVSSTRRQVCNSQSAAQGMGLGLTRHGSSGYVGAALQTNRQKYGSVAEGQVTLAMQSHRLRLEGAVHDVMGLGSVSAHLVQHRYKHGESDAGVLGTQFASNGSDASVQVRLKDTALSGGPLQGWTHKTALGWQREQVRFSATGDEAFVPVSQTQTQAAYWVGSLGLAEHSVNYGLRRENAHLISHGIEGNTNFVPDARKLSTSSAALGAVLDARTWLSGMQFTMDWSRYGRVPKDYELFANGEHVATGAYERGDVNLGVERATHRELGARWRGSDKRLSAAVNTYRTDYANYIYLRNTGNTSTDGNPVMQLSQTPAIFSGWEWRSGLPLGNAPDALLLSAHHTLTQGADRSNAQALPRIPPKKTGITLQNAGIQSSLGKWQWQIGAVHHAAQNQQPSGASSVASYTLWHARTSLTNKTSYGNTQWFVSLNNATNQLAYPATSVLTQTKPGRVPLAGRDFRLGVQLSF